MLLCVTSNYESKTIAVLVLDMISVNTGKMGLFLVICHWH